jgi:hypothetical protein
VSTRVFSLSLCLCACVCVCGCVYVYFCVILYFFASHACSALALIAFTGGVVSMPRTVGEF